MTNRNLFERLLLALPFVLAACAPGSGGTGTGPTSVVFSGTGSAVVFVTASTSGQAPGPGDVPLEVQDVCSSVNAPLGLDLQDARIQLDTPCSRFIFEGQWAQDVNGRVVVTGRLETPSLARVEQATLQLQFGASTSGVQQVTVTLTDAFGRLVTGPAVLFP